MERHATLSLARYLVVESYCSLPRDVVEKAKTCLIDSLGCLLGGYETPVAHILKHFSKDAFTLEGNPSPAALDPAGRAFVYATLINALDFDDIYRKGHPGATAMAAALAVADVMGCSGRDLITAIVVGYEVGCRVGLSLIHDAPRKTVHGHGTWQIFGAVAAAAKLLRLDRDQAAHALAIAAVNAPVASVMKTVYGASASMAKSNFGTAARSGVDAAFLARSGFKGPLDVFEGETGFWRMAGAGGLDASRLTGLLGEHYEIRDVGFKVFSCCRIIQSSVEAVLGAFEAAGTDRDGRNVSRIIVSAPEIVCRPPFSDPAPTDIWAAQFSAPFAVAFALLGYRPGPDWFKPERFTDPSVRSLTGKIELRALDKTPKPKAHHPASMSIHLTDGRVVDFSVDVALGDAAKPVPCAFIDEKFLRLAALRWPSPKAQAILQSIKTIENAQDVRFIAASHLDIER